MIVDVDLSEALPQALAHMMGDMGLVEAVLTDLAEMAWLKWRNLAARELHSSRQTYIDGIQEPVASTGERTIALVGWLPNAIENGLDSFDLRETLLGSNSRARRPIWSESGRSGGRMQVGWYANIPFRHGTPGSSGLAGQPMGAPHAEGTRQGTMEAPAAQQFGKEIYQAAKQLRTKGGRGKGPMALPSSQAGPKLSPHHSTSIYTGMRRVRKPYKNERTGKTTVQSQYFTWRRISTENSNGWIHPGIEPRRLSEKVEDYIHQVAPGVVQAAIKSAMRKG